jgi:hypothetical protein
MACTGCNTVDCECIWFTVDLRWQELTGVRACGSCDAQKLAVDAWRGRGTLQDLTDRSSGAAERQMKPGSKEWWWW